MPLPNQLIFIKNTETTVLAWYRIWALASQGQDVLSPLQDEVCAPAQAKTYGMCRTFSVEIVRKSRGFNARDGTHHLTWVKMLSLFPFVFCYQPKESRRKTLVSGHTCIQRLLVLFQCDIFKFSFFSQRSFLRKLMPGQVRLTVNAMERFISIGQDFDAVFPCTDETVEISVTAAAEAAAAEAVAATEVSGNTLRSTITANNKIYQKFLKSSTLFLTENLKRCIQEWLSLVSTGFPRMKVHILYFVMLDGSHSSSVSIPACIWWWRELNFYAAWQGMLSR